MLKWSVENVMKTVGATSSEGFLIVKT